MGKRGVSSLEYLILIGLLVAAVLSMEIYVKRSIQGNLKSTVKQINDGSDVTYAPGKTTSLVTYSSNVSENVESLGNKSYTYSDKTEKTGSSEYVGSLE